MHQVKDFKHLRVMFMNEVTVGSEADKWLVWDSSGEAGAEIEGKAFVLSVDFPTQKLVSLAGP